MHRSHPIGNSVPRREALSLWYWLWNGTAGTTESTGRNLSGKTGPRVNLLQVSTGKCKMDKAIAYSKIEGPTCDLWTLASSQMFNMPFGFF